MAGAAEEAGGAPTSVVGVGETPGDLEGEVVPDLQEGGKGPLVGDPALQVVIGAAQSPQDIEHQDPIGDGTPEVVKAELANGEVPLREGAEGGVELEGVELGVAEELPLERHSGLSRGAAVGPDGVLKI